MSEILAEIITDEDELALAEFTKAVRRNGNNSPERCEAERIIWKCHDKARELLPQFDAPVATYASVIAEVLRPKGKRRRNAPRVSRENVIRDMSEADRILYPKFISEVHGMKSALYFLEHGEKPKKQKRRHKFTPHQMR